MSKKEKFQQRLEWLAFRLKGFGLTPEDIQEELSLIRERKYNDLCPKTVELLDFDTFKELVIEEKENKTQICQG